MKIHTGKRKKDEKYGIKEPTFLMECTDPIIYQGKNQKNIQLTGFDDDNSLTKDQEQQITNREAKEIANYSICLHKDIINNYNSVYLQLLQDISNSYSDDFKFSKMFMEYPFAKKNIYSTSISNGDKSLKLIDDIMTKNIDTFIKSIELTKKFYKDVMESYLNCIKSKL